MCINKINRCKWIWTTIIVILQDAITAESYYKPIRSLTSGDTKSTFATLPDDQVLSGEIRVGGQVWLLLYYSNVIQLS